MFSLLKIVRSTVVTAACFSLLLACGSGRRGVAGNGPEPSPLVFDTTLWRLGTIRETDAPLTHVFRFTNTGTSPLAVEQAITSCGCTFVEFSREPVMPGGRDSVRVTFDPRHRRGGVIKIVRLLSGSGRLYNNLQVNGTVLPAEE